MGIFLLREHLEHCVENISSVWNTFEWTADAGVLQSIKKSLGWIVFLTTLHYLLILSTLISSHTDK